MMTYGAGGASTAGAAACASDHTPLPPQQEQQQHAKEEDQDTQTLKEKEAKDTCEMAPSCSEVSLSRARALARESLLLSYLYSCLLHSNL